MFTTAHVRGENVATAYFGRLMRVAKKQCSLFPRQVESARGNAWAFAAWPKEPRVALTAASNAGHYTEQAHVEVISESRLC